MSRPIWLLVLLASLLAILAEPLAPARAQSTTTNPNLIRVAPDGWHFQDGAGRRFTPIGCTYADPATWPPEKRMERWDAGKTGPAVIEAFDPNRTDRHFTLLSETTRATTVRVFLSPAVFMPELGRFDDIAFKRLDIMIDLASRHNLRLVLDIAEVWEGQAPWLISNGLVDFYANDAAIHGVSLFAAELGRRYRDNPTIFAWNIQNEPFILGANSPFVREKWRLWLKEKYGNGDALKAAWADDFPRPGEVWPDVLLAPDLADDMPGNARLYDFQLFREYLATRWIARIARVLKNADPNHLVTVGLIQFSSPIRDGKVWGWSYPGTNPLALTPYVDFMSMHAYLWDDADLADYIPGILRYAYAGKPVILEEFRYDDRTVDATIGSSSGWLSWWCFDDPETKPGESLFDLQGVPTKEGLAFAKKAVDLVNRPALPRQVSDLSLLVDRRNLLTSGAERDRYYTMYVNASQHRPIDFFVPDDTAKPPWQMALTVTAPTQVQPGQPVSYTLTYTNPALGPPIANEIVVTAVLDRQLVAFQGANQGARFRPQDATVVLSGESARAGVTRSFRIDGIVSPEARPGQSVVLRSRLSAREELGLPEVLAVSQVVAPGTAPPPTTTPPLNLLPTR